VAARRPGLLERPAGQLDALLLLDQRVAGRLALGAEEAEAHRTADQERVGGVEEGVDQRDLVRDLGAAEQHHQWALRRLDDRAQRRHLALEQESRHRRMQVPGDADRGRVRPVGRAEGVVHVGVGQPAQLLGQRGVVLGLAPLPAGVLEHQHAGGREPLDAPAHLRADHLGGLVNGLVDQFAEPLRGGPQRGLGVAPLGPAQVRAEDEGRTAAEQQLDGGQRGADAGVVGDPAALERHVEVDPDEHPLPLGELDVSDGALA
jgi:hypothetical protein